MGSCEKCWHDAYMRMLNNPSKSQSEHYHYLLEEREEQKGNLCTPKQQAGQFWDNKNQCDSRN